MTRSNASLADVFATSTSHVVTFDNLRGDHDASNTVYVAVKAMPEQRAGQVSRRGAAPFEFTGRLLRVTVDMHDDQKLDGEGRGAEMARQ